MAFSFVMSRVVGAGFPITKSACLLAALLLSACVYYPTTDKQYQNCTLVTKKLELDYTKMHFHPRACNEEECMAQLAVVAAVPATTFIVSGSIVVIGNALHWMEKEGTCEEGFVRTTLNEFLDMLDMDTGTSAEAEPDTTSEPSSESATGAS